MRPARSLVVSRPAPTRTPNGPRPLTILDASNAASYALAVARLVPAVERSLRPCVVANRATLVSAAPPLLRLEQWRAARDRFLEEARRRAGAGGPLLVADVRACYASIRPEVVAEQLRRLRCSLDDVRALLSLLAAFERAGVDGLPVGPDPSAVLANAVLAVADDAIVATGADHVRWVDDFWVFARDSGHAREALVALHRALAEVGLELAPEKTRVLEERGHIADMILRGRVSPSEPRYHPDCDAHPLSGPPGPHALVPPEGRVDPGGRPARAAGGDR